MFVVMGIILSFSIYLADQASDCLTALLLLKENHLLEGSLTIFFILLPGIAACLLELRDMWKGSGNLMRALTYLLFCPLWAVLTHIYAIHNKQWRTKALLLKTMEGFLCSSPQLILQLSLWIKGTLTGPAQLVLINHGVNVTSLDKDPTSDVNMTLFGRDYNKEEKYWFGLVQILSILLSFLSVLFSVVYFNVIETVGLPYKHISPSKLLLGIPFFLLTLLYRSTCISILICFLGWWSSLIIFLLLFISLLTALSIGDMFPRAFTYSLWSLLAPVGYSRDPMTPLGYKAMKQTEFQEEKDTVNSEIEPEQGVKIMLLREQERSSCFLTSHVLTSLFLLLPSLIITTILVHRAVLPESTLVLSVTCSFPLSYLSSFLLPSLGLCLATTLLLVRPYHRADTIKGEGQGGTLIV